MKKRILYIILGMMLLSVKGMGQTVTFDPTGATTFCYGNSTTKLRISTSVTKWFQLQYAPLGTTTWSNLGAPTQVLAGTPQDVNPYYSSSQSYQIIYSSSFSMTSPTTVNITIDLVVNPLPIINQISSSLNLNNITGNYEIIYGNTATISSTASSPSLSNTWTFSSITNINGSSNTNIININAIHAGGSTNLAFKDNLGCSNSIDIEVLAAPLTITAVDKSKLYGAAVPALTYTYTGLVNGDVATTTLPTISTTGLASSPVGNYSITTTSAADVNYTISYVAGILSITKVPLTITVEDKTKVYGAILPVLTVAYTGLVNGDAAPSTLPAISTTALASSPVGTYSITATGAVDPNYTISYVVGKLAVTKAILTITAEDKSKLYGAAVPALTYTYSGLVNGDAAPSTTPSIITTALASSPVDSYPITVSAAADANYTINYVPGILIVDKVPLIITAENKTKTYGTANPVLTYTYSGLVNGDLATITWPTIITAALPNSSVGVYEIIPSAATDPNYTISYVNGSLTVTKAPLTITAKPHIITYNGTAYAGGNGIVPTGLAAGESISNLTGTLNYAGTSQGAKNVGSYTIIPGGLSSPNYDINYVGDNLEIKKATLNVVAGDQSVNFKTELAKILNDAVYTYSGLVGGDNASDITGSVTYTTNYTPLTSTGASGIYLEPIITGLSNSNYDIIAVNGTITITAPPSSPVFQIPNAFTPNFDGHNDTFKIIQNGYVTSIISFRIFTKSGKLIFNDKDGAWDGRFGGVMLDADVYIWIADFINKNNDTEHLSGTVLLLK